VHKGVLAYFIILILMIIGALFVYGFFGTGPSITTSTTTVPHNGTTTTIHGGNTTITTTSPSITTTSVLFSTCMSKNATEKIVNGNFSTGNYFGWTASGPGFGSGPLNLDYANANGGYYSAPWNSYDGTYVATTYTGGLLFQAGNLTSKQFTVTELYLNFKIVSPQSSSLYVEILEKEKPVIITYYDTYIAPGITDPQSTFVNASIPLGTMLCKNVSVRLVAGITGTPDMSSSYIAAGDFYLSRTPVSTPGIVFNQTIK